MRQLLQFHPDLQRTVHASMHQRRAGDGNGQSKPEYQLGMLRSKAQAAEKAGKKDGAVKLWQQVLQIEPTDYQASRAGEGDSFF